MKSDLARFGVLALLVVLLVSSLASSQSRSLHDEQVRDIQELNPLAQNVELPQNETSSGLALALAKAVEDTSANLDSVSFFEETIGDAEDGLIDPTADPEATPAPTPTPDGTIPVVQSDMPYMVTIYIGSQRVVVYGKDDTGAYTVPVKVFTVSTGLGNNTIRGTYRVAYRWRWLKMHSIYCQYVTQWSGNYLFHSVMYSWQDPSAIDRSAYARLGSKASAGCIRMTVRDAKWIYDNIASGTVVVSTTSSVPAGTPGSAGIPPMTLDVRWDPTDPDPNNPYNNIAAETPTESAEPTESLAPSDTPLIDVTTTPSETPSETPTDNPSETPTDKPSETPTDKPSETPTDKPSEDTSEKPPTEPSGEGQGEVAP